MNINKILIEHSHLNNVLAALENSTEWIDGLGVGMDNLTTEDHDNYLSGTEAVKVAIRKRLNELSTQALKLSK